MANTPALTRGRFVRSLCGALTGLAVLAMAGSCQLVSSMAGAATADLRLVMVEEIGCRFCAAWDADVGAAYAASKEGRRAPLNRVKRDAPLLEGLKPAVYTPTFILLRGPVEIGRITGYPGPHYFWEELRELIAKSEAAMLPRNDPG